MGNGALQIGNGAFRIVAATFRIVVGGRNRRNGVPPVAFAISLMVKIKPAYTFSDPLARKFFYAKYFLRLIGVPTGHYGWHRRRANYRVSKINNGI